MRTDVEPTAVKWVERFSRAFDSVRATTDPQLFLTDLADACLQVSRAGRAYAILMRGDEVLAEAGLTGVGDAWSPEDEIRKLGARNALRAGQDKRSDGRFPPLSTTDGSAILPFITNSESSGCVILRDFNEDADGIRDLGLAAALTLSHAWSYNARAEREAASDRASKAETRQREIERSVSSGGVGAVAYLKPVVELERDAIELALRTTQWNKEDAARRLGISRASIYMKVKKHGLQRPPSATH